MLLLLGSHPSLNQCCYLLQASRIVAQLLVAGATTVFRAASQAWHQALQSEWSNPAHLRCWACASCVVLDYSR